MQPKYSKGDKVKIKSQDFLGRILDPKISQYENQTAEVIEAVNIVAFIRQPWSNLKDSAEQITLYHYSVRTSTGAVVHDILEDCLEITA